jgi:hypothetical protein
MSLRAIHLFPAAAVGCRGSEHGCGASEGVAVILMIVLVVIGSVLGVCWLVWARWERGPFWWIVGIVGRGRRGP